MDNTKEALHPNYEIIKIDKEVITQYELFFNKNINKNILRKRINNTDCTGFLAIHKDTNDPVGFEWCIVSRSKEYRHDNFLLPKGYGLLFNAYVSKPHRGKGVFRTLKIEATNHLLYTENCISALSVVEKLNTASIIANSKIGSKRIGINFLLKLLGRNLFSITKIKNKKTTVDYVLTGNKNVRI